MPARRKAQINGEHALYHFLQKELLEQDVGLFQAVATSLALGLGVWISPETYARFPLLKPYARRDPDARGNARLGIPDQWGAPDESGRFRDDNSLIKRLPYTLPIEAGANRSYQGKRIAQGFVCAHVWRHTADGEPAARDWRTYSFVPNLVWLPEQVAKLTDRPGSFLQSYLQALAVKVYRDVDVPPGVRHRVEASWGLLEAPTGIPPQSLPDIEDLNRFTHSDRFIQSRCRESRQVANALRDVLDGLPISTKLSKRYGEGLPLMAPATLDRLHGELVGYLAELGFGGDQSGP